MEKLTVGQVIDQLKLGEVAIKVSGNFGDTCTLEGSRYVEVGIYYDENDSNVLKSLGGGRINVILPSQTEEEDYFVIMNREAYKRILDESFEF